MASTIGPMTAIKARAHNQASLSETLLARVGGRADDASAATADVVRRQLDDDLGRVSRTRIDAGGAETKVPSRLQEQ